MPRVLVFGTFDHLHPGHEFVLSEAQKRARLASPSGQGELHVVIARDKNVEKIKGRPSEKDESERLAAVQKVCPDCHPILGDEEDFLVPVHEIQPDLILLGYDQKLPPGVSEEDLPCKVERLEAFEPEKWKSSLQRKKSDEGDA